ncbi:tRNA/rRNA methyltransferase (SpoU) [Gemmatirosa kalamazoonensis]|uniref:tRNA/rRNA methyltransferase (SpoU) n=1 Tax=Gemmatirosa kalamazoonensis TaxID=861299 RepID=W0RM31_9BACT|nr:RNA methyltransferase [Gemmatirosa kalamazoonensis]AHG91370.1 tRNA/rRNA methyltransferase (SpoU) [Gemmatirosa kalamazoonensis]
MRLLSLARDLRRRRARERHGLFVAEGVRAVEELLASAVPVRGALAAPALDATERGASLRHALEVRGVPLLDVSDTDFASAADTDSPQGVLAVAEQPRTTASDVLAHLGDGGCVLLLDAVQDPGNAGTMLRSAAAFDAAGVIAVTGTVDLWGAKVVRSAMGALFHQPVAHAAWEELDEAMAGTGAELWGADGAGQPVSRLAAERPARLVLAVGNEGAGLSQRARARASRLAAIPIAPGVESLNAAVAAGILLYELRPEALRG